MSAERSTSAAKLRRAAAQQLESLELAGVTHLPKGKRRPAPAANQPSQPVVATPKADIPKSAAPRTAASAAAAPGVAGSASPSPMAASPAAVVPSAVAGSRTGKSAGRDSLEIIRTEVAGCTACHELASTRTQTVFGVGNPQARLCFLGEAPGADEDRQGEPFVGRAGQLLTKIIEACTLTRQDVYILNVLKCRPPGNRNPAPDEVSHCRGFLDRQLALIQPEYICCLGTIAAQTLLQTDTPISRLRGKFVDYNGIAVMCTYHPAYLLRNPAAKKDVWEDMKVLMARMGIKLS